MSANLTKSEGISVEKLMVICLVFSLFFTVISGRAGQFAIEFAAQGVSNEGRLQIIYTVEKLYASLFVISFCLCYLTLTVYFNRKLLIVFSLARLLFVVLIFGAFGLINAQCFLEVRPRHDWITPPLDAISACHYGWPFTFYTIWNYASGEIRDGGFAIPALIIDFCLALTTSAFILVFQKKHIAKTRSSS